MNVKTIIGILYAEEADSFIVMSQCGVSPNKSIQYKVTSIFILHLKYGR